MADFIPIAGVGSGGTIVRGRDGKDTVAVTFSLTMSDPYSYSTDGVVDFVARLYFAADETDGGNQNLMHGNGGYDFPNAKQANAHLGFRIMADGTASPPLGNTLGCTANTADYKTFTFIASLPAIPIYVLFCVCKSKAYNGRVSSIYHWEHQDYALTLTKRIQQLQDELDAEAAGRELKE